MSGARRIPAAGPVALDRPRRPSGRRRLHGSDLTWAIAFIAPYAATFIAFALYPIGYALWMGGKPSLYADLIDDPLYLQAAVNTLLFAGLGVNLQMFLALLLSGFFMRRRWWIRALLVIYILPWVLPAVQAFNSVHWILIGEEGFVDSVLSTLFGIQGPLWFNDHGLALGSNIVANIWKWLPFWTLTFFAARTAIPQDIYEAADMDG